MKRRVMTLAVAAALLLGACSGESSQSAPPLMDSISVSYDTAVVERGDVVASIVYDAYVTPMLTEATLDEASGVIDEVLVRVGDEVAVGDPLFKLNTDQLDKRLDAAKTTLEELESTGALDRRTVEIDLELAKLDLEDARDSGDKTAIDLAKLEIERKTNALSDYDAQYAKNRSSAAARVSELEEAIAACTLRSPVSGNVVALPNVGDYASAASGVVTIATEEDRTLMYSGLTSMLSNKPTYGLIDGEVVALTPYEYTSREIAAFEAAGRRVPSRFVRADGGELPPSGGYVQLTVVREQSLDTLRLPLGTVKKDANTSYVYVIRDGEKIYTEVKTGVKSGAYIEITDGLKEGDVVYVDN